MSEAPTTLVAMLSDVSMELVHMEVTPDVDHYIMTRVRDKMVNEHGYSLAATLDSVTYAEARQRVRDELERSVAHKERECRDTGDTALASDCRAAREAIARWNALT